MNFVVTCTLIATKFVTDEQMLKPKHLKRAESVCDNLNFTLCGVKAESFVVVVVVVYRVTVASARLLAVDSLRPASDVPSVQPLVFV